MFGDKEFEREGSAMRARPTLFPRSPAVIGPHDKNPRTNQGGHRAFRRVRAITVQAERRQPNRVCPEAAAMVRTVWRR